MPPKLVHLKDWIYKSITACGRPPATEARTDDPGSVTCSLCKATMEEEFGDGFTIEDIEKDLAKMEASLSKSGYTMDQAFADMGKGGEAMEKALDAMSAAREDMESTSADADLATSKETGSA